MRDPVHVPDEKVENEHIRPPDHGDPVRVPALPRLAPVALVVVIVQIAA